MADLDPKFIGEVISSIPYDQAFGAPLQAGIDAQTKAAKSALDFVLNVGFTTDKEGVKHTNYAEFTFEETNDKGLVSKRSLKVPLILLVNIPQLEIESGEISFDLEISQQATMKDKVAAEGELEGKVGWGPFSVSLKAKASYDKERTRSSDTRAKQHVMMKIKQAEPPEALNILLEIMRDSALGAASGKTVAALAGPTGGTIPANITPTPVPETNEA